jgi:flavin reductase (DIM6/NTAB) family NADH-FMN oxidoreductase RutF
VDDEERARIRGLFGRFATGVTVVAARHGPLLAGMTANAIASISVDPPVLLVSVSRKAETHRAIIGSHAFAVSVLADDQRDLAECFAQPTNASKLTRFCDAAWHEAETGSPILEGALAYYDCRLSIQHDGGDHAIFLGDVVAAGYRTDASPLLWYGSAYHRLGDGG